MKKEFFFELEKILYPSNINDKFTDFYDFYENFKLDLFVFNHENESVLKDSSHPSIKFKEAVKIRRVKEPNSNESLAKFLHSIAHIEFSAINLALDSAYRFKDMPRSFYADFLEVADEEISHFLLLQKALFELGFKYGDFIAHNSLNLALNATANSLKYRMAVVHRGLEAKGLDANIFVLNKLKNTKTKLNSYLQDTLNIILDDEIKHVSKGDIWWKFSKKDDENFIDVCKKFKDFILAGRTLNEDARLKSGFSKEELEELKKIYDKNSCK